MSLAGKLSLASDYTTPKHPRAYGCKYPAKVYTKKVFFPELLPSPE